MFFKKKFKENIVQVYSSEGVPDKKFALIAFNGEMKEKLLAQLHETYRVQGTHVRNGGKANDNYIRAILGSGTGALGLTGAASGTLYMATAAPATLMTIGSGYGSAVIGAGGGIIAQAPFIPVAGALMPVAAPLLAFTALATTLVLQKFEAIADRLKKMESKLDRLLQRTEAIYIGELISASSRLESIEQEFQLTRSFTSDTMLRLSLVEDKVNPIFERYKYLFEAAEIDKSLTSEDLKFKKADASLGIVLSILDLRIDVLRLKLYLQEAPGFLEQANQNLNSKIETYQDFWKSVESSHLQVEEVTIELDEAIQSMNWYQRNVPNWLFGKRRERKELEWQSLSLRNLNTHEQAKQSREQIEGAQDISKLISESLQGNVATEQSIIYWQDQDGIHSYYTNDVRIAEIPVQRT